MATEYERKFRATPENFIEIDETFSGQTKKITMETTYYDTPSGQLSARRYTLRKRLENGVSVCAIKAPAGAARGEWETVCKEIEAAVPVLVAMGAPEALAELVKEGIIPICGAKFTRVAKEIPLEGGLVELALDQGILFGGRRESPLCEIEVELKTGTQELCDRFADSLATRFCLAEETRSKFARARMLHEGENNVR